MVSMCPEDLLTANARREAALGTLLSSGPQLGRRSPELLPGLPGRTGGWVPTHLGPALEPRAPSTEGIHAHRRVGWAAHRGVPPGSAVGKAAGPGRLWREGNCPQGFRSSVRKQAPGPGRAWGRMCVGPAAGRSPPFAHLAGPDVILVSGQAVWNQHFNSLSSADTCTHTTPASWGPGTVSHRKGHCYREEHNSGHTSHSQSDRPASGQTACGCLGLGPPLGDPSAHPVPVCPYDGPCQRDAS